MGVSARAQEPVTVSIYDDCSKNGKKEDIRTSAEENGHTWVDLGLPSGIKWATCNVGATTPEGKGNYYAWGETETKAWYSWGRYKYANGDQDKLTKYCNDAQYGDNGFTDNLTTLEPEDDAATANWGGSWRMPTDAEWAELKENCTWTYTTLNGIVGCKVTSHTNSKSIFLPAIGYRSYNEIHFNGECHYWSVVLCEELPACAGYLGTHVEVVCLFYKDRHFGLPVRPVCP